jgi:hypothetical protein
LVNPYAGAGDQKLHEHDTRIFFFDELLTLLGWELGVGGNVAEEARIKSETTKFVDYVGVNADTRAPALILEAKAWDKPGISGKGSWAGKSKPELIVAAIQHLKTGGSKADAPVVADWHEYLAQLAGYVQTFKKAHRHNVPAAVLSSGRWLLIFTAPVATFCDGVVNDQQFLLLELNDYVANAHKIYESISRVVLADTAPERIYSEQLSNYISPANFKAAYHGLLIRYEKSGAPLIGQHPRILVYPALIIERGDSVFFTVIDAEMPILVQQTTLSNGAEALGPHIQEVTVAAEVLLERCSSELGLAVTASPLDAFPGFPENAVVSSSGLTLGSANKLFIRPVRMASDLWLAATGHLPHFLLAEPALTCRFHSWSECQTANEAIDAGAVSSPVVDTPRAFFVDGRPHHCANRIVINRREARCHISAIDCRICCMACAYRDVCWSSQELANLRCGK